jgi:L-gulonate 3-dehydrogenase
LPFFPGVYVFVYVEVNPPYLIPLVEIVPAPWTAQDVVTKTRKLLESVGQAPIVLLKESNGFVLNRLQYALLAEAFRYIHLI